MHYSAISMTSRPALIPGTALAFSVLMAFLGPRYSRWFGDSIPALTRDFFALYPLWIVITTVAVVILALADQFPVFARWRALWSGLDTALGLISTLIIAIGLIALFLPLLLPQIPG